MTRFLAVLWLTVLTVGLSWGGVQAQDTIDPRQGYAVREVDDLLRENFEQYNRESLESFAACSQQLFPNPTWEWYWTRKAYLNPALPYLPCVRGEDRLSRMMTSIVAPIVEVVIHMWNGVMAVDAVRLGLLVVCAGMLLGVGAKLVKAA